MTKSIHIASRIPPILRLVYKILELPAKWLLKLTPKSVQNRWFGSDVFDRYTTYYTWITNQLGHFTVGAFLYFVAWCLAFLVAENATATCPAETGGTAFKWALGFGCLLWLLYAVKEVADVEREHPRKHRRFRIDLREAALDGWTDAFFVGFGIVFAHGAAWIMSDVACDSAFHSYADFGWLILIVVGIGYAIDRGRHFLPQKKGFDASDLPFYFRLTRFYNRLRGSLWQPGSDRGVEPAGGIEAAIEWVASGGRSSPHVCIFGPGGSGKTTLAVGIACNLLTGPRPVLYLAASDLIADERKSDDRRDFGLLAVDQARWIVVDHISPLVAVQIVAKAVRLAKREDKPLFIFACDHELEEDQDAFVRNLSRALDAPCLAVHLDEMLPRRGSRVAEGAAAERPVPGIGIRSPAAT